MATGQPPIGVTVVLGGQWGDEGKGKLVDLLAEKADYVCRCQVMSRWRLFCTTPMHTADTSVTGHIVQLLWHMLYHLLGRE